MTAAPARAPFPLRDQVPEALCGILLDFHWSLVKLHALNLPEVETDCSELRWHLELPFWSVGDRPFVVTPLTVAANPVRHPEQWRRTLQAELAYPLDTYRSPAGQLVILDGVHRLLKATVLGWHSVRVRELTPDKFDRIAVSPE